MATAYWTVAAVTFSIVLVSFLQDRKASKTSADAWIFIAIATLLWPITLPSILNSKLHTAKTRQPAKKQPKPDSEQSSPTKYSSEGYFLENSLPQSNPPAVLSNLYTTTSVYDL